MSIEASPAPRPELSLDPIVVSLSLVILSLWGVRGKVARQRRHLDLIKADAIELHDAQLEANGILAGHTRRLSDELFRAEVELQTTIAADLGEDEGFWDEPPGNDAPGGPLRAVEDPPKGIDPESRKPSEEPAQ